MDMEEIISNWNDQENYIQATNCFKITIKTLLFLLLLTVTVSLSSCDDQFVSPLHDDRLSAPNAPQVRTKRGAFWDIFQKMVTTKNLVVDQFVDTKNTLNEVYNILNSGFSDPAPKKPTLPGTSTASSTTEGDDNVMETTTEEYRISRYELGRILGRNYRGLQRLAKIEWKDSLNQTQYNIEEYRTEARKQFANSIAVEKKKKLESLKG